MNKKQPKSFTGWTFVSDNPRWKHYGEILIIGERNVIDSSYYDCIALDGSSPAVSTSSIRDMFNNGKLTPPAGSL